MKNDDNQTILKLLENQDVEVSQVWFNEREKQKLRIVFFTAQGLDSKSFEPSAELAQVLSAERAYTENNSKYFTADFLLSQLLREARGRKFKLLS